MLRKKVDTSRLVRCLGTGCDKEFLSRDPCTNRLCSACEKKLDHTYIPHLIQSTVHVNGRQVSITDVNG